MLGTKASWEASQDIPDVRYADFAQSLGLKGIRVEHPERIELALKEALSADRPAVLDIVVDPNVPIIPPHIDKKMLKMFSQAMLKGDPESFGMMRQIIKQSMQGGTSL